MSEKQRLLELADLEFRNPNGMYRMEQVLRIAFRGIHHLLGWEKRRALGDGLEIKTDIELATFDFDTLTRLVVAAHDECVRVAISPGGSNRIRLTLHPRKGRAGKMWDRHPALEAAITFAREPSFRGEAE